MLRKVIWIAGTIPTGMSQEQYKSLIPQLAHVCGGELVEFGSSYMIIGTDDNKKKLDELDKKSNQ